MRIFRLIILSVLSLSMIITIISLFIPSHIRMSKAIQIHTSKELAMEQIGIPGNWKNWYPEADSSNLFYENNIVKGLILNRAKQRYVIMTGKSEDEVMAVFTLPNKKIQTGWQIIPSTDPNSITVQWYIDFHLHWYPWEKFTSFMFEKIYSPQLQQGLDTLKARLEK